MPGVTFAIVVCSLSTSPEPPLTITVTWPNGTSAGTTAFICPGDTNFKGASRSTPVESRKITDIPPSIVGNGINTALLGLATKLSPKMEANESGATGILKLAALVTASCRGTIVGMIWAEVAAPNSAGPEYDAVSVRVPVALNHAAPRARPAAVR